MNPGPRFDVDDPVLSRVAWSCLTEPADEVAGALLASMGSGPALKWLIDGAQERGAPQYATGAAPRGAVQRLDRAVARWRPRLDGLDPRRQMRAIAALDGIALVPGDPRWPPRMEDLGLVAPICLWVRGEARFGHITERSVAIVGARASTEYGNSVAADIAGGMADRGWTTVSGGAFGIDAAAHRGSLGGPGPTVAFLAGGVDRFYPAGNAQLLRQILLSGGSVVSELPPGSVPSKVRFLLRNRLIAAVTRGTVVIEAAWRSGSLATAARAAELLRPVGAVPGPVTSPASAGCHRLLRETDAVCVTDAEEVVELVGASGQVAPAPPIPAAEHDGLDDIGRRLHDALPLHRGASVESVARVAGLSVGETIGGLGHLELLGIAVRSGGGWRRARQAGRGEAHGR